MPSRTGRLKAAFIAACAAAALAAAGCRTPPAPPATVEAPPVPVGAAGAPPAEPPALVVIPEEEPPWPPPAVVRRYDAGWSVEGRPIECIVLGTGDDVVLLLAAIHGEERAGTPLLRRLVDHLEEHPELLIGRQVVLVPAANPDGGTCDTRGNAHDVDLNRNFPAANRSDAVDYGLMPLSEPESSVIRSLIRRYRPRRIVSIHSPLACVDYDGPGEALAARMARDCSLPLRKLGGRPGSLGSYAGIDLGIPIVTLELPPGAADLSPPGLWTRYGTSLIAAVVYPQEPAES